MKLRSLLKSLIMYYLDLTKILPFVVLRYIALHCSAGGTIMEKTTVSRWTRLGMVLGAARNGSAQSCIVFGIMHNIARNRTILYCIAFFIEHNTARHRTIGRLQGAQIWC